MKTRMLASIVIASLAFAGQAAEIRWEKTYGAARKLASKTGKLVMVDFYTDWCGWCKKLDEDTYTDANVVKLASQVVSVKLDAEKEGKEQAKKYGVKAFPTILFLTAKGEVAGKIVGYLPPARFAGELTRIVQGYKDFPRLQRELKGKPADGRLNARMALALCSRGKTDSAVAYLMKSESAGYTGPEMAKAYNAVGDAYQTSGMLDAAIVYFEKAEKAAQDSATKSYAMVSLMSCHMGKNDWAAAKKVAQQLVNLQGADPEYVRSAEELLKPEK